MIEKFAINLSSQSKLIMMTRFYAYYFSYFYFNGN